MRAFCFVSRWSARIQTCLLVAFLLLLPALGLQAQVWDLIEPADMRQIGLDAFEDSELDLPYYVANFHKLATAVESEDPERGFFRAALWRPEAEHLPHNARVMENILALAFFYTQKRPWNPWYGDPQLRIRLEAALAYWLQLQDQEGFFSEIHQGEPSLAATSAATKFMSETLHYVKDAPPLNEDLVQQVTLATRQAILGALYSAPFYEEGKRFSGNYTGVFAGALCYLALHPDAEMRKTLELRLRSGARDFQSPLGYMYENDGPDTGHSLDEHLSTVRMASHYARQAGLQSYFETQMKEFYVWLVWNVSVEKNREGYYLNTAINTRASRNYRALDEGMPFRNGPPLAESIRLARPFALDETARAQWAKDERKRLSRIWPNLPELQVGSAEGFSPYVFLHRRHTVDVVSQEAFREVMTALPCTDSDPFNHIKQDERGNLMYFYANRPKAYYIMFAAGESVHPRQTLGITAIRSHSDGTVLLAQPANTELAWGTRPTGAEDVFESTRIFPGFNAGEQQIEVKAGGNSMSQGDIVLNYRIGEGMKTIYLFKDRIDIEVEHPGEFIEQLPMLVLDGERPNTRRDTVSNGKFRIEHKGATASVGEPVNIDGPRTIYPVRLQARDRLRYSLRF